MTTADGGAGGDEAAAERGRRLAWYERDAHRRCGMCGRFVTKDRWTKPLAKQRENPNASIVTPLCPRCRNECDPPEW